VRRAADAGARDFFAGEKLAEAFVERRKVLGIAQDDAHVDHVRHGQARRREDARQVGEGLARLLADVGGYDLARLRIERSLAGNEQEIAGADRLRKRRRCALVGESGDGRIGRGDDLLRHAPSVGPTRTP